ncbi:uncharacterized protein PODANS_1_200 [Podospora anserina S mat+]|uniref:Podospora anserina S mat+ genomic DNA chromosome 1, supercontig 1 n=1 Tax=Podospora anserina (strain S / ATCC MYA-4624 / DSM 980 / FGSC 10383) TaxID=515849 RepID=B2A9J1_PODAN|nr:uncharacterized protein PODANS_1_200 [Podospora anserina S mat+]CAP59738.1 unnamed protein product [Podospora anserina S mat+]CDP22381.1 Putative protein of unknown function [Podospora anserina S mat+]
MHAAIRMKPAVSRTVTLGIRPYASRAKGARQGAKSAASCLNRTSDQQAQHMEFTSNRSIFGPSTHTTGTTANRHFPSSAASPIDERARSFYSTVIYHGQTPNSDYEFDESQVFGSEVKVNPTQSEANVAADRGDIDPLPQGMHQTILMGAGEAGGRPTEAEEDVHADLYMDDPLRGRKY